MHLVSYREDILNNPVAYESSIITAFDFVLIRISRANFSNPCLIRVLSKLSNAYFLSYFKGRLRVLNSQYTTFPNAWRSLTTTGPWLGGIWVGTPPPLLPFFAFILELLQPITNSQITTDHSTAWCKLSIRLPGSSYVRSLDVILVLLLNTTETWIWMCK